MLTDYEIIHRSGQYEVMSEAVEITLRDGTALRTHRVQVDGIPHTFLRAFELDEGFGRKGLALVDVGKLATGLREDMLTKPARDHNGLILYTLRERFQTASYLAMAVRALCIETLTPEVNELQAVAA